MNKQVLLILMLLLLAGVGAVVFRNLSSSTKQSSPAPMPTLTISNSDLPKDCQGQPIPELTEGPYYKGGSPKRQVIREANTPTQPLTLEGYVFDTNCQPIANAWIDFWQADGNGQYDNEGYRLRGHQYTDEQGRYRLETVVPGMYPGRTEHIHFKIKASSTSKEYTSQLFLPDGAQNQQDAIFHEALIINLQELPGGQNKYATYNFVIAR